MPKRKTITKSIVKRPVRLFTNKKGDRFIVYKNRRIKIRSNLSNSQLAKIIINNIFTTPLVSRQKKRLSIRSTQPVKQSPIFTKYRNVDYNKFLNYLLLLSRKDLLKIDEGNQEALQKQKFHQLESENEKIKKKMELLQSQLDNSPLNKLETLHKKQKQLEENNKAKDKLLNNFINQKKTLNESQSIAINDKQSIFDEAKKKLLSKKNIIKKKELEKLSTKAKKAIPSISSKLKNVNKKNDIFNKLIELNLFTPEDIIELSNKFKRDIDLSNDLNQIFDNNLKKIIKKTNTLDPFLKKHKINHQKIYF